MTDKFRPTVRCYRCGIDFAGRHGRICRDCNSVDPAYAARLRESATIISQQESRARDLLDGMTIIARARTHG